MGFVLQSTMDKSGAETKLNNKWTKFSESWCHCKWDNLAPKKITYSL